MPTKAAKLETSISVTSDISTSIDAKSELFVTMTEYLLQENGDKLLQENGDKILLESGNYPNKFKITSCSESV